MENFRKAIVLLFVFLLFAGSCKKDPIIEKDKTELMTQHKWRLTALTSLEDLGGGATIFFDFFEASYAGTCEENTSYEFKPDSTYISISGCDSTEYEGSWYFYENENKIIVNSDTAEIITLNYQTFKIESVLMNYKTTWVYSKY